MTAAQQNASIQILLDKFPKRPFEQAALNKLVSEQLRKYKGQTTDIVKSRWEFLLKEEVFRLASTEGTALKTDADAYYDSLRDRLDLVLTFTEHDVCDVIFPVTVLQDLLETQTIPSCSHIFTWIESQQARLTSGMIPQKGKALVLLRTLNDLLRRLSKAGSTTLFCGRILTFLSGVFPLGERSGVNLRGEYGPIWDGPKESEAAKVGDESKGEDAKMEGLKEGENAEDKMEVDGNQNGEKTKKSDGFYSVFWSLQLPFSRPPVFASTYEFTDFQAAVEKVLPVLREAAVKERALMGNRTNSSQPTTLKRKREPEIGEELNNSDYFFAKFLTSPELLELEIADTHFRRQILFQILILLHHLLQFTKAAKDLWSTPRNRSLQMDFTLELADAQWVQDTIVKAVSEIRSTTPSGPMFADLVNVILEREKNWVKWKNEMCPPFDKEPWSAEKNGKKVGLIEATEELREKKREPPAEWPYSLGSESLTEIWEMGYRELWDLQNPFQPGDVKDFVKKIKQEDARIEMRKQILARHAERIAQARAKVAAAAAAKETPVLAENPSTPTPAAKTSQSESLQALSPTPAPGPGNSAIHPSLPPKPGSTAAAGESSQAVALPAPTSAPSTPTPAPAAPSPAPTPTPAPVKDDQINGYEENKHRWSWLALRTARDQHLQHFGKIGNGDIIALQREIEAEAERDAKEREKPAPKPAEAPAPTGSAAAKAPTDAAAGDSLLTSQPGLGPQGTQDKEGDVRMEER